MVIVEGNLSPFYHKYRWFLIKSNAQIFLIVLCIKSSSNIRLPEQHFMARPTVPRFPSRSRSSSCGSSETRDLSAFPGTRNLLITMMGPQERNPLSPLGPALWEAARRAGPPGFSPPGLPSSLALDPHLALEQQEAGGRAHLGVDLNLSLAPPGLNMHLAPETQEAGGLASLDLNFPPPGMASNLSQGDQTLTVSAQGADVVYPETTESVNNY